MVTDAVDIVIRIASRSGDIFSSNAPRKLRFHITFYFWVLSDFREHFFPLECNSLRESRSLYVAT